MQPTITPAEFVLAIFTITNALQIVSYIPQIVCVLRDRNGASTIAYSTWAIWFAGSAATTAYAMINIWDVWLAVVNGVHTLCCLAVIALTAWKRVHWHSQEFRVIGSIDLVTPVSAFSGSRG